MPLAELSLPAEDKETDSVQDTQDGFPVICEVFHFRHFLSCWSFVTIGFSQGKPNRDIFVC